MGIQEGFDAVRKAIYGDDPAAFATSQCTRCQESLIVCPLNGTAQPQHSFEFHLAGRAVGDHSQPWGILMGMPSDVFSWRADLCNRCLLDLKKWLNG